MKKLTIMVLIFTVGICAGYPAFGDDLQGKVKSEAEKSADALLKSDFETVIQFTYPAIIEKLGGKEKAVAMMQEGSKELQAGKTSFDSVTIGAPGDIKEDGNWMYTLVPQTIKMKTAEGLLTQDGFLLGVSPDHGTRWYFIDATHLTDEKLSQVIPELVGKVKVPAAKRPVLTPK